MVFKTLLGIFWRYVEYCSSTLNCELTLMNVNKVWFKTSLSEYHLQQGAANI